MPRHERYWHCCPPESQGALAGGTLAKTYQVDWREATSMILHHPFTWFVVALCRRFEVTTGLYHEQVLHRHSKGRDINRSMEYV